eukprot:GCRY01003792.1.p1 GENE.GCRY01003792.1~~GCRY01003792.1.p1  ORF type:complete len:150 (-),score=9.23 GCRY01003792.1:103-552(-)
MPKVKRNRSKPPPEGWELIEPTVMEFEAKMREIENEEHEGKRICETTWPIMKLHHQRSRFIYELYYKKKEISRELYEWCLKMKYADAALIAKWKKSGYHHLCCLRCIQASGQNFKTACICRVPKSELPPDEVIECRICGCRGCADQDCS